MIEREQLAEALAGLDARDREVLDLSLRRRVPDEDLASVYAVEAAEIARRRAGAVERLSGALGVQRGEDLGHMLKLLLEGPTWDLLPAETAPPAPPAPQPTAEPEPVADEAAPEPEPAPDLEPTPVAPPTAGHRPVGAQQHEPPEAPPEPEGDDSHEPVLGMLAGRPEAEPEDSRRRTGGRRLVAGLAVALAVLAPAGMVAALTGENDSAPEISSGSATTIFEPENEAIADPFPDDTVKEANRYPIVRVKKAVKLLDSPGGRFKVKVGPRTEFKTGRVLSVVRTRGEWLAVLVPELDNGEVAWLHQDEVAESGTVAWSLHVDLSKRVLVVRKDGENMRSVRIGIGRPDHETPTGRFAVTDKLRVSDPSSPYGCCVLALTGHQTKLPPGWPGGDRLAVHATANLAGLGKQVSLGCMRTDPRDTKWMLKQVPLGTPVFIQA